MQVNYVIVHELVKEQRIQGAKLIPSEALLPIDDKSNNLIFELNKRFRNHNAVNAYFGDQSSDFPSEFNKFNANRNEKAFIEFTTLVCEALKLIIAPVAPAKGGYLVITDYIDHGHYTAVYLIRNKTGMLFKRKDKSFTIDTEIQLDLENLAMACRINCSLYNLPGNQDRYLRFIKKDSEEVSEYFRRWITMNNSENMKHNTSSLYQVIKSLPKPLDNLGKELSEDDVMKKALMFIKDKKKEVNIRQLSSYLYNNENAIHDFAIENGIVLDSDFRADTSILGRYLLVKVKADNVELKFPKKYFDDIVMIHQDNPDVITITSKELADKILKEIRDDDL